MITSLLSLDVEMMYSSRFNFKNRDQAKKDISAKRTAMFQKKKKIGAVFTEAVIKEQTQLEDTEALSLTQEASEAMSEMSNPLINFGEITTTIVLRNKSYVKLQEDALKVKKVINDEGYVCKGETFNNAQAFLGALPGNITVNKRNPTISTANLAHFFPLTESWRGNLTNDHLKKVTGISAPHMITRAYNNHFFLNLNVDDVGHTLIVGPTGAGKSILLNTLALQYFRYPTSRIFHFDKDKASKKPCMNMGGSFFDLGSEDSTFFLNPFFGLENKAKRVWFSQFLSEYFRAKDISVSPADENAISTALFSMQDMRLEDLSFKTFKHLLQDEVLREALDPFIDGSFSHLFKPVDDSINFSKWTVFEMNTLMEMGEDIVQFVLGYLFFKLNELFVVDGTPTLLLLDECWIFLDNDYFADMLKNWLKTLRKKNVYVVMASQEVEHTSTIFSTVVNACMTKILLPNASASQPQNISMYYEIGCNDDDIQVLMDAKRQREYLYFSQYGKQVFNLYLDERQINILTQFCEV
jgi:type IV secretion system protein VirB4